MALTLSAVAKRAGVTPAELKALVRNEALEMTFSTDEAAAHFGCTRWQIWLLCKLGLKYGEALHPTRGGLWPTWKASTKSRRIPLSAIERHKRHMDRKDTIRRTAA